MEPMHLFLKPLHQITRQNLGDLILFFSLKFFYQERRAKITNNIE